MTTRQVLTGVLLEDAALTIEELARAVDVEPDWVVRHVHAGVLGESAPQPQEEVSVQVTTLRFRSGDLVRARRLRSVERDFDANEDLAGLVVDMAEEIRRLRARLHVLGVRLP